MTIPYLPRLFCLVFASFFVVHFAAVLLVAVNTRFALRAAQMLPSHLAARLTLALRLLPFGLGLFAAFGLGLPSYLWFEPAGIDEPVGAACLVLAALGAAQWAIALTRTVRSAIVSFLFTRRSQRAGQRLVLAGETHSALVVESSVPLLALTGILRPQIVISQRIVDALSPEELSVVFGHERSHLVSRDNWKRFCISLAPGVLPFVNGCTSLERWWARFSEYAADEDAAAGDSRQALALASALVQVARFGIMPPQTGAISFLGEANDLSARVDRLLALPASCKPRSRRSRRSTAPVLLVAAGGSAVLVFQPSTFRFIQSIFESLMH